MALLPTLFTAVVILAASLLAVLYARSVAQERARYLLSDDLQRVLIALARGDQRDPAPFSVTLSLPSELDQHAITPRRFELHHTGTIDDPRHGLTHVVRATLDRPAGVPEAPRLAIAFERAMDHAFGEESVWAEQIELTLERFTLQLPVEAAASLLRDEAARQAFSKAGALHVARLVITPRSVSLSALLPDEVIGGQRRQAARQRILSAWCASLLSVLRALYLKPELEGAPSALFALLHGPLKHSERALNAERMRLILYILKRYSGERAGERLWDELLASSSSKELLELALKLPEEAFSRMSEAQLIGILRCYHAAPQVPLSSWLPRALPRLPTSLLADASIDFEFKFKLLTAWLSQEAITPERQQAIVHAMLSAYPFERQRIQRHVTALTRSSGGRLSISLKPFPIAELTMIAPAEEEELP